MAKINYLFTRTTLAHAIAGSVGGMTAMTLCYPLDRVRTIAQLSDDSKNTGVLYLLGKIVEDEGILGLYKGLKPILISLGTSNFVYFYFYVALKAGVERLLGTDKFGKPKRQLGPLENLLLASVAGTINVFVTTPLWVVSTRMAMSNKKQTINKSEVKNDRGSKDKTQKRQPKTLGYFEQLCKIYNEEGVASLWSGLMPSLMLVSNPSVQFVSYEKLKSVLVNAKLGRKSNVSELVLDMEDSAIDSPVQDARELIEARLSSVEFLMLGALAKMIATFFTYPLQVAQSRMRARNNSKKEDENKPKYKSTTECLKQIYNSEGFAGLYRGMDAKLLQTCLTSAFMFALYEKLCKLIFSIILWRKFKKKRME